jgi:N-acetyl-S-(2-succino)cysteine monooxygenase
VRDGKLSALSRWPQYMAYFEPLILLPALAPVTRHIGLLANATTSYNDPTTSRTNSPTRSLRSNRRDRR